MMKPAGKRGARIRQSEALTEAARLQVGQAAWLVRSRVRSNLLAWYAAQQTEEILQHQQKELGGNEELMEHRARAGLVSPFNATQAIVLAGKNSLALEDARRAQVSARAQLADALGLPLKALDGV